MAFIEREVKGQAYRVLTETTVQNGEEVNSYDKISMWTDASDVDLGNGISLEDIIIPVKHSIGYYKGTLSVGASFVFVSIPSITSDSMIDIYVPRQWCKLTPEKYNIVDDNRGKGLDIFFPLDRTDVDENEQDSPIEVRVICKNLIVASGVN